jgi:hypothetical protein
MTFYRLIALPIQMIRPANPDIRTLGGGVSHPHTPLPLKFRPCLQLFKNSNDTREKFRLNLHSMSVSELLEYGLYIVYS